MGASASVNAVIAIDGPSGSGKSTLARALAAALGWQYLDTGAMYRAAALAVLRAEVDPADEHRVASVVNGMELVPSTDPRDPGITLGGVDVSDEVRAPEVTAAVSAVAAVPAVRQRLVALQRGVVHAGAAVVEGRDIGTVVFPAARLKVWLTARDDERARRRAAELAAVGMSTDAEGERARLAQRDRHDSTRAASPALPAGDALVLDSTELSTEELVHELLAEVRRRGVST